MKRVDLNSIHTFEKTHAFSKNDRLETYDEYECTKCHLKGRKINRDPWILVSDSFSEQQITHCNLDPLKDIFLGKQIQIIKCTGVGKIFKNLTPESIHTIVKPIDDYINGDRGVWVQGMGEKVKVLFSEYKEYEITSRFTRTKISTSQFKRTK